MSHLFVIIYISYVFLSNQENLHMNFVHQLSQLIIFTIKTKDKKIHFPYLLDLDVALSQLNISKSIDIDRQVRGCSYITRYT